MYVQKMTLATLLLVWQSMAGAAVELSDPARHNFGITTVVATPIRQVRQWPVTAQVLDASGLVTLIADLSASHAALRASSSELQRVEALYKADNNAALKTVEAARAQSTGDQSRVQTAQAQLLGTWGTTLSRMSMNAREQLAQNILAGRVVLLRAEVSGAAGMLSTQTVRLQLAAEARTLPARLLGSLPQATQTTGRAYLLSVAMATPDLQPGQLLSAQLQDAGRTLSGISLPRAAVLRWQGRHWAYIEIEPGHYQREALTIAQWLEDAVLVTAGIKAGDQVVTTGAGLLLGAELQPADATQAE